MAPPQPLKPEKLHHRCDPAALGFASTDELTPLEDGIGHDRALAALEFGIGMRRDGYNLFALGPPGTGKHEMVRRHIERRAASQNPPDDWCYVNNFTDPQRPRALRLPAGRGAPLKADMERLVEELRVALPATFEADEFRARKDALDSQVKKRHEEALEALQNKAVERGITLIRTPMGFALAPTRGGEVLSPEDFRKLPQEAQDKAKQDIEELEHELEEVMNKSPQWAREHRDKMRQLINDAASATAKNLLGPLRESYADLPEVLAYLDHVEADAVENAKDFFATGEAPEQEAPPILRRAVADAQSPFRRYRVNVMVDHAETVGAPVVFEDLPTHPNLLGRIEHMAQFGALLTDFNLIRPGALHRANGGYLMLDARKVLMQPYVWEQLKRALRAGEIKIEGLGESMGLVSTTSLEPEPIPLDVKIVLIGERMLYYLLAEHDPDFVELFKVPVDFEDSIDRNENNDIRFARLVATIAQREKLRALDAGAVARVIEHGARLADDSIKLTTQIRAIADLVRETDYWAGKQRHAVAGREDVEAAIAAQIRRVDRVRERSLEVVTRGIVLIDTEGAKVGQVNGLAVRQLGEFRFGGPSRITARVRLGRGEVVDIEREVELGGPLHSKGVLILAGYIGARFATEFPLALSASLVFEQSYGGVDGDSASSAELYALLSALSGVPIKQSLAVTGSVNQYGQVQAIGGANEKIEGFFDLCRATGLNGEQGVLIPASNVTHLMLRRDVVEAAAAGKFHIYPVATIDEGIEILTGVPAGQAGPDGGYPPDSVNGRALACLRDFAERTRSFARAGQDRENG